MRRRFALLSTLVLALLLIAAPALAAENGEQAGGSGDDLWTGLIYAFFAGLLLGIIAFVDSTTGSNSLDDLDHGSH